MGCLCLGALKPWQSQGFPFLQCSSPLLIKQCFQKLKTSFRCCCLQEIALPLRSSHCSALQPNTAGFSVAALAFSSSEVPEGGWRLTALSDQPLKGWLEQMSSRVESFDGEQFLPHTADLLTSQALHGTSNYEHQTYCMSANATLYMWAGLAHHAARFPCT